MARGSGASWWGGSGRRQACGDSEAARSSGEWRLPCPREERLVAGGLPLLALVPAGGGRGV
eukprot:9474014-Pyramimonas_sp.AAC.1